MPRMNRRTALLLAGTGLGLLAAGTTSELAAQGGALRFDLYKDSRGAYRWKLKAANGQTIGDSGEGYKSRRACLEGIGLVQRGAASATIREIP